MLVVDVDKVLVVSVVVVLVVQALALPLLLLLVIGSVRVAALVVVVLLLRFGVVEVAIVGVKGSCGDSVRRKITIASTALLVTASYLPLPSSLLMISLTLFLPVLRSFSLLILDRVSGMASSVVPAGEMSIIFST